MELNWMLFFHHSCKNLIQIKLNKILIQMRILKLDILAGINTGRGVKPPKLCVDSITNLFGVA